MYDDVCPVSRKEVEEYSSTFLQSVGSLEIRIETGSTNLKQTRSRYYPVIRITKFVICLVY